VLALGLSKIVPDVGWEISSSKKGIQMNQIQTIVISRITTCKGTGDIRSSKMGLPGMKESRP